MRKYFDVACEVLNMTPDELRKYISIEHTEADRMIKDAWNRLNPQTEQQITEFYTKDPSFTLFHIRLYHSADASYQDGGLLAILQKYITNIKECRILDYGCGCGLGSLSLINCGCKNVTLADVPSPLFEIARRALAPHIGEYRFLTLTEKFPLKENYDLIICADVLEHVRDPDQVLRHLADHTKYLYMTTFFGGSDYAPPHLRENNKYAESYESWIKVVQSCDWNPSLLKMGVKLMVCGGKSFENPIQQTVYN